MNTKEQEIAMVKEEMARAKKGMRQSEQEMARAKIKIEAVLWQMTKNSSQQALGIAPDQLQPIGLAPEGLLKSDEHQLLLIAKGQKRVYTRSGNGFGVVLCDFNIQSLQSNNPAISPEEMLKALKPSTEWHWEWPENTWAFAVLLLLAVVMLSLGWNNRHQVLQGFEGQTVAAFLVDASNSNFPINFYAIFSAITSPFVMFAALILSFVMLSVNYLTVKIRKIDTFICFIPLFYGLLMNIAIAPLVFKQQVATPKIQWEQQQSLVMRLGESLEAKNVYTVTQATGNTTTPVGEWYFTRSSKLVFVPVKAGEYLINNKKLTVKAKE
jgi:hypothetical protein